MQPTEGYSVSRRALDVEDYIDIMRRHRGWIFGPFLLCLVGSVVGAYLWPETYQSQSVVKIVPQQVPENMVQAAVNQVMSDRVNAMAETILARSLPGCPHSRKVFGSSPGGSAVHCHGEGT